MEQYGSQGRFGRVGEAGHIDYLALWGFVFAQKLERQPADSCQVVDTSADCCYLC